MPTDTLPAEIREALAKIERAERMVSSLCAGERRWTMSVPARPNDDPDLVIGDGLNAGRKAIQALVRERAEAKRELEHIKTVEFPRRVEKVAGDWQALRARAEAAEQALEEARADTERLDWLSGRKSRLVPPAPNGTRTWWYVYIERDDGTVTCYEPDEGIRGLRAAIDAARSAEGEHGR